ncbi:hypothetical protein [Fibrisoma limi]|nr:hypothetical protein [Fibrisoma limi]
MKTVKWVLMLVGLASGTAWAQSSIENETIAILQAKKGETPQQVMTSISHSIPSPVVRQVASLPVALRGKQWAVIEQNRPSDNAVMDFYEVAASGKDMNYQAYYDKAGNLLSYRQVILHAPLPDELAQVLRARFPGWTVVDDRELVRFNKSYSAVYRVELANGKARRHVELDENGTIRRPANNHSI